MDGIDGLTLEFFDPALEASYRAKIVQEQAGKEGIRANGAIIVACLAVLAHKAVQVDDKAPAGNGTTAFRTPGREWEGPMLMATDLTPLFMAIGGMISHVAVGRTGNPALEHQLVVGVGTIVMVCGLWVYFACCNAAVTKRSNALLDLVPLLSLWQALSMLAMLTIVFVKMHQMCFPFRLRAWVLFAYLPYILLPNVLGYPNWTETILTLSPILLGECIGYLTQKSMRRAFLQERQCTQHGNEMLQHA